MKAQRKQLGQLLNRSMILPFYLGQRVFVPLKMRKALAGNDMVYGYFDGEYIEDIQGGKFRECRVLLKTGDELECFSSQTTAQKSLHLGLNLQKALEGNNDDDRDEQQVMEAVRALYRSFKKYCCACKVSKATLLKLNLFISTKKGRKSALSL